MNNNELEKFKFYANQYHNLIIDRIKTIILIIQLLIALLVIAGFSEKIVPPASIYYLKILIIFLLSLVPIMLVDYLLQLNDGLNSLHKVLKLEDNNNKLYKKIIDGSNYIYALIAVIIIDIIILLINQNFQITLIIFLIQVIVITILICVKRKKEST